MSATALSPLSAPSHAAAPDAYSLRQTVSDALSGALAALPSCLAAVPVRPLSKLLIHSLPKAVKRRYEDEDDDLGDEDDDLDFEDDDLDFEDEDDDDFDDEDFEDDDLDFDDEDFEDEDDEDDFEDQLVSRTLWQHAA